MNPIVELIAIIAVAQFFLFGFLTGKERRKSGLKAPAITGDDGFERMYRVQSNTLETLIAFLPALFIASNYVSYYLTASLGLLYIIGRFIYWISYTKNPTSRGLGFMMSMLPTLVLIVIAIFGALYSAIG